MMDGSSLSNAESESIAEPTPIMDARQQRIFELFVGMGYERTLTKLVEACKALDHNIGIATLNRWSQKFKWYELVKRTDAELAKRLAEEALPLHVANLQKDLDYIGKLKDVFYARVDKKEITVELADFVTLLKIQGLLIGDPTKRIEHITKEKHEVTVVLSDEQLENYMRFQSAQKHGLPPPTYEHADET